MRTTSLILLLTVSLLLALSVTMLSSAVMLKSSFESTMSTQVIAIVGGLGIMSFLWRCNYLRFASLHWWFYGLTLVVLVLVLSPLGTTQNGAQRWLFSTQPGEFAKIPLLLTLAAWGSQHQARICFGRPLTRFLWGLIYPSLIIMPLLGLLYQQPDRGTMILFGTVTVIVLLLSGMRLVYVSIPLILGFLLCVHFYNSSEMVRRRATAYLHPELYKETTGVQALKSLAALREGGISGVGLGAGIIKHSIPEQQTDFILPVIGEEMGLRFTLAIILAFVVILLCAAQIASRSTDSLGRLLAGGIGFLIAGQATINIAVVTNSIINKGMPLPFVSRGGSCMITMLALIGLLLSIARQTTDQPTPASGKRSNPFTGPDLETLPTR